MPKKQSKFSNKLSLIETDDDKIPPPLPPPPRAPQFNQQHPSIERTILHDWEKWESWWPAADRYTYKLHYTSVSKTQQVIYKTFIWWFSVVYTYNNCKQQNGSEPLTKVFRISIRFIRIRMQPKIQIQPFSYSCLRIFITTAEFFFLQKKVDWKKTVHLFDAERSQLK